METFNNIVGIATVVTALIPLAGWILESIKRRKLESIERRRIWSQVSKIKGIMNDIEKDINESPNQKGLLQAHAGLAMILRDLFEQAVLTEKKFSLDTIEKWRRVGKISSDWQEKLCLTIIDTVELGNINEEKRKRFGDWDEVSSDSPVYSIRNQIKE